MSEPEPRPLTLNVSRWRKAVCAYLIDIAGYVSQGRPLQGVDGPASEVHDPYAAVVILLTPDGASVGTFNMRSGDSRQRAEDALFMAFHPDGAEYRRMIRDERSMRQTREASELRVVGERDTGKEPG